MTRWKRWALGLLLAALTGALLLGSRAVRSGVETGLSLCVRSLIPSLFPLAVMTDLILSTGYGEALGRRLSPVFHRILGSEAAGVALVLGLLGGYPLGARALGDLAAQKQLSRSTGERLLGCCNNAGPAFILGVVGLGIFRSLPVGLCLYLIHGLSALGAGYLLRQQEEVFEARAPAVRRSLGAALPWAVLRAGESMVRICSFVVFFSVLLALPGAIPEVSSLLERLPSWGSAWVAGLLELSCGIFRLDPGAAPLAAFVSAAGLLAWGGVCVYLQARSVVGDSLTGGFYWRGKLIQTGLSLALALPVGGVLFRQGSPLLLVPVAAILPIFLLSRKNRGGNPAAAVV